MENSIEVLSLPLSFIKEDRYWALERFLEKGLDPDFSYQGKRLITWAREYEAEESIQILLEFGAAP